MVVATCLVFGGASLIVGSAVFPDTDRSPAPGAVQSFAGFSSIAGLEVTDASADEWLDASVNFTLRGSPGDITRALEAAQFTEPFIPGIHVQEPSGTQGVAMFDVRSAQDTWDSPSSQRVHRRLVRGTMAENPQVDVLHVLAFTT